MPRLIRAALAAAGVEDSGRVSTGVDVVGDIAIVRLAEFSLREKRKAAKALLGQLKNVRVVMEQEGGIEGEHRLRKLKHLAGEKRTLTLHRENGCSFRVDVARCYFSPRLSTERLRVANGVASRERVLNMFAGVGPFSIEIAKLAGARVTSCEVNHYAAELHRQNNALNKVDESVGLVEGDAADLPSLVKGKFDRVLMPLPSEADRFLGTAISLSRKGGTVHYYRHVLGEDEGVAEESLRAEMSGIVSPRTKYVVRKVREVGPRWLEMVAEIRVPG